MKHTLALTVVAGILAAGFTPRAIRAENEGPAIHEESLSDEAKRAQMAAQVLEELVAAEDAGIPEALLAEAYGVAVIPNVVKGALMVGGQYGKGLVATRDAQGHWNPPAFIQVGGASYGFQAGIKSADLVLIFTGRDGVKAMLEDNIKLGADVSVAAGPVGRTAEVGTNVTLDTAIVSYSQSKGLFAGAALEGAVLSMDHGANEAVYGPKVNSAALVLGELGRDAPRPKSIASFRAALDSVVPKPEKGNS